MNLSNQNLFINENEINRLNRKHFVKTDMYYRVGYDLSSKLLSVMNGIMIIEVTIGKKWKKSYNSTAHELAHCRRKNHQIFKHSIAAKIFIIDQNKSKRNYEIGETPSYHAKKGVIFQEYYMN